MESEYVHVVIYRSGGIGDVVLATSCMDILMDLGLPMKVYWLGREPTLSILSESYRCIVPLAIDSAAGLGANLTYALKRVAQADLIIDLQKSARSQLICWRLALRYRKRVHSWNKASMARTLMVIQGRVRRRMPCPEQEQRSLKPRYFLMAECLHRALGLSDRAVLLKARPRLPLSPGLRHQGEQQYRLGIGLGALHPGKEAPLSVFLAIVEVLLRKSTEAGIPPSQISIICLGDETIRGRASEFCRQLQTRCRILDCTGQTSLVEAAAILRSTQAFLGNDSALGHLAEAVGTPVAILFGPTIEGFGYAPFLPGSASHSIPLGCRPCTKDGATNCRYHDRRCFTGIDPEAVAGQILWLWKEADR
ncbi:glycosyltransferase family 9 protein [Oligoflexus tunisiensis]|uniref:glycosyltransferase family 9 protein n=1 Tax=Oligoflexus tunisiensis TaxID=708132 RepID=UPI00114CB15B|nr:glycosyltransferase family 9 protein [Oligoflexus tunisiensis]